MYPALQGICACLKLFQVENKVSSEHNSNCINESPFPAEQLGSQPYNTLYMLLCHLHLCSQNINSKHCALHSPFSFSVGNEVGQMQSQKLHVITCRHFYRKCINAHKPPSSPPSHLTLPFLGVLPFPISLLSTTVPPVSPCFHSPLRY